LGLACCFALALPAAAAEPRDELLRVAPPDSALLVLVQDAREHARQIEQSPFAQWFPQSALGKQILGGADLKQLRDSTAPVFAALGVTPETLLDDVLGDAVAFAFTPAAPDRPKSERAVLLIRPRKPETLEKLIAKLNEIQKGNGEVKEVVAKQHRGADYFERQKPNGGADYYCFRGGVFAFSGTEPDIQAVIDRDTAKEKPTLLGKIARLGIGEAMLAVIVNPRPFDAELQAKVARAVGPEKFFLDRFQEAWQALDSAALYVTIGEDLEAGLTVQFQTGKLSKEAKAWLTGARQSAAIWQAIRANALIAVAGQLKPAELVAVNAGQADPIATAARQMLGPVFGKDHLNDVLGAIGPQWALWIEPPAATGDFLPTGVVAMQIDSTGPKGKSAARDIARAVGFGFNTARIAYNASHVDQIELVETDDADIVITSLVNDKKFPAGFRPSYAFKGGFLLVASSPEAIKRFRKPKESPSGSEALFARFSGSATRAYLQAHREPLARFLSAAGNGSEKDLLRQFDQAAAVLELVDRVEVFSRGDDSGLRLAARFTFAKPLRK
jgi:hypothetical protein